MASLSNEQTPRADLVSSTIVNTGSRAPWLRQFWDRAGDRLDEPGDFPCRKLRKLQPQNEGGCQRHPETKGRFPTVKDGTRCTMWTSAL